MLGYVVGNVGFKHEDSAINQRGPGVVVAVVATRNSRDDETRLSVRLSQPPVDCPCLRDSLQLTKSNLKTYLFKAAFTDYL